MEQQTMISFQLPKDLAIKARVLASRRNLSRSELLRQAIERFVNEEIKGKREPADVIQIQHG